MCSGCGRCGEAKRTRSEANGLAPGNSLIQVETQARTAKGSEQPCGVTVSRRNDPGQLTQKVDKNSSQFPKTRCSESDESDPDSSITRSSLWLGRASNRQARVRFRSDSSHI
jgi:hypothetical protein